MPLTRRLAFLAAASAASALLVAALDRMALLPRPTASALELAATVLAAIAALSAAASVRTHEPLEGHALLAQGILASGALAFFTLDTEDHVESWNRGAELLFGWSAGEVVGKPLSGSLYPPAQAGDLVAEVQRIFETGREHPPHARAVTSRDGRTIETLCAIVPFREASRVRRVAVVHVDPHSPQLVEGRWNRLFHAAPAGLLRIDPKGHIEAVNRRFTEWTGRRAEALEGLEIVRSELFPEEFRRHLHDAAVAHAERVEPPFESEVTLVAADGAPRPCVAVVAPRPGSGADVVLVDGRSRERLRAERDAARAAADAARQTASETVSTHRDLTRSVAQLMSALETARDDGSADERRVSAEQELERSGRILLANIERIERIEQVEGEARRARPAATQVLLVDDNDENRELIAHMFRSRGAEVTSVPSGREAVDAVARAWFDVVLLDVQMPEMDGYQVARRIRSLPGGEKLSVVALTALGADAIRERCLAEGMDDFVSKPLTLAKVREILARWGRPQNQPAG